MWQAVDAESFKKAVEPLLKAHGFTKAGGLWRRDQTESIAVFNVQNSQWDGNTYYVNIGTYFRALGSSRSPAHNKCHVQLRLEVEEPQVVVAAAVDWFQARAVLRNAALLAESDSTKGLVFKELRHAGAT